MTDFRAELQRIVQAHDDHGGRWPTHHEDALFDAVEFARAALAQPEPQGPSPQCVAHGCLEEAAHQEPGSPMQQLLSEAGKLLSHYALAQPEPQGPGPDDVTQLYCKHGGGDGMYGGMGEVNFEEAVEEALARWGRLAIEPVPMSERLPGPEDCFSDQHGQRSYKCWAQQYHTYSNNEPLRTVLETWDLVDYRLLAGCRRWYYAWLPYWALPVPKRPRTNVSPKV